jgi:hypothetical protein
MGMMTFQLPAGLTPDATRELERACVSGGPDNMPWPTESRVSKGQLVVRRGVEESGSLVVPWDLNGAGRLMGGTATLIEREAAYHLLTELCRGKVNQLRCQAWEWRTGGLQVPAELDQAVHEASLGFSRTLAQPSPDHASQQARHTLSLSYEAADKLVRLYTDQVFQIRRQRQAQLDTAFGVRVGPAALKSDVTAALNPAVNSVNLPFAWSTIEPAQGTFNWDAIDELLEWATEQELRVTAGPLIDFSAAQLPDWLWLWERDLGSLAKFMIEYATAAVKRYRQRLRRWHLTAASNWGSVLSLGEDELQWLTVRLVEVVRQIDPGLELIVGVAQPWGEYLAQEDRSQSPFLFADTLVRSGLNLAAIDLELVMGVSPRGSYCRDLLETSRLLDLYAILGVPLRVTLGYPSAASPDTLSDPEMRVAAGRWRELPAAEAQSDWAASFAALALCKPYVQGVHWAHLSDGDPHQFPHCGLFDAAGKPKPALQAIRTLREQHVG